MNVLNCFGIIPFHLVGSLDVALRLCSYAFVMLIPLEANTLSQANSVEKKKITFIYSNCMAKYDKKGADVSVSRKGFALKLKL